MHVPIPRPLSLIVCVSLAIAGSAFAHVNRGPNCASCHTPTTGAETLGGNLVSPTTLAVSPRLDGGNTAALPCFTVQAGGSTTVTLDVTPQGVTGDGYAFAITGDVVGTGTESLGAATVTGVQTSTSDVLGFTVGSGWTTQVVSGLTYFTDGPLTQGSGPTSNTFVLTISGTTPPDVYTMTYRAVGIDSDTSTKWSQSQEFLINVLAPPPLLATTGSASAIQANGASLNGTVTPDGVTTSAYFQYGLTTSYGSTTGTQQVTGISPTAFSEATGSLIRGATYHFCAMAVNATGTSQGADMWFTTPLWDTNATLSSLTLSSGTLSPQFSVSGTSYSVSVPNSVTSVTVTATPSDSNATAQVTGGSILAVGTNPIAITVTAQDGVTTMTYMVTVTRAAASTLVAAQNQEAPGFSGSAKFVSFGTPDVNDLGHSAFLAKVSGGKTNASNDTGIWAEIGTSGTISLLVRSGVEESYQSGTASLSGTFTALSDPVFNDSDEVAFMGKVKPGGSVTAAGDAGIWAWTSGTLTEIAQIGQASPDATGSLTGSKFTSFTQLVLPKQGGAIIAANLALVPGKVTAKNNEGIWACSQLGGTWTKVIGTGSVLTEGTVSSLTVFAAPGGVAGSSLTIKAGVAGQTRSFDSAGDLIFIAELTNKARGIYAVTVDGGIQCVTLETDPSPTVLGATTKFTGFGVPIINDAGQVAFLATLSGTGAKAANYAGIVTGTDASGALELAAVTGVGTSYTSGTAQVTGTFVGLSDPVYSGTSQLAFLGTLKTGGAVTASNSHGVWAFTSGTLALVANEQGQAKDCPVGAKFSSFTQLVLPNEGGAVILANLAAGTGGVSGKNNEGIWAVDTLGSLNIVVRKGDALAVDALGHTKNIGSFLIFSPSTGNGGQTRNFDSAGDLVYKAIFTDGTQGIYKVMF